MIRPSRGSALPNERARRFPSIKKKRVEGVQRSRYGKRVSRRHALASFIHESAGPIPLCGPIVSVMTSDGLRCAARRAHVENEATLMHHKAREMLVSQRTQLNSPLRGRLAEIGSSRRRGSKTGAFRNLARLIFTSIGLRRALRMPWWSCSYPVASCRFSRV
jgi:hypothetical protein